MKAIHLSYKQKIILYFALTFVIYTIFVIIIQNAKERSNQERLQQSVLQTHLAVMTKAVESMSDTTIIATLLPPDYTLRVQASDGSNLLEYAGRTTTATSEPDGIRWMSEKTTLANGNTIILSAPYNGNSNTPFHFNDVLFYLASFLFFGTILIVLYFFDKFWGVMKTLKDFAASAEKGTVDYATVHFPDTYSGEVGNKIISLYKQLETSKRQIIEEKDRNRQLKQEMTNNIAHELKTPVSSIRGYLEILLSKKNIDESKKHYFLERSYSQTLRLSNLINDVSIINKMEESSELFLKEEVYVSDIAGEAILELEDKIQDRNISISNSISADISIVGNHSLLYGIFRNLIENAVSHAGENIEVGMECHREDMEFYYFRFYDTGCGIQEQYLTRIFDRFLRIDEGRSRKNGGTGLGLSIVKHAVLFHGGGIIAKNAEHGGLEFYFSLAKK
jgi:signal transduction histidine kinase